MGAMSSTALLRGINVGGKNKVEMGRLRQVFEQSGLQSVRTYINTGNVLFAGDHPAGSALQSTLEQAIAEEFGLDIKVLLRTRHDMLEVVRALPETWVNDSEMKCDVMFLWEHVDDPGVLDQLPLRPDVDEARYVPGAVIWRTDRANVTRSGMTRIVGTKLYKAMTVRNCNTVRTLVQLLDEFD